MMLKQVKLFTLRMKGFTLIELVMVILLLGILSAVAVPRFLDVTSEAHNATVNATAGAMGAAVMIAHAKWLARGQPTSTAPIAGIDFTGSQHADLGFSEKGWPNAANTGRVDIAEQDVLDESPSSQNNQICAQIMRNLLSSASIKFGVGKDCSEDYCATYEASACRYTYQKNKKISRIIFYSPETGAVIQNTRRFNSEGQ